MLSGRWLLAALLAASIGCGGDAPPDPNTFDGDRDGVVQALDCDDASAARWRLLQGHPDRDRDGRGTDAALSICSGVALPPGYAAQGGDCDDGDAARWFVGGGYRDVDGDGSPEAPEARVCRGDALPSGWSETPADCAPLDPGRWTSTPYLHRDVDGDTFTVASPGEVCAGAALPVGYSMDARGDDCDDANATVHARVDAFQDADGDGVGGAPGVVCAGAVLPAGWTPSAGDCDDGNGSATVMTNAYRDGDLDGRGLEPGSVCGGRDAVQGWLPPGWSRAGADCDDADASAWQRLAYAYVDRDGDLHALAEAGAICTGSSLPGAYRGFLHGGWTLGDCDDTDAGRHASLVGYLDADLDGWGYGAEESFCTAGSLPPGYAAAGGDCAPGDATRWVHRGYSLRDADGDLFWVRAPPSSSVCSGAALPPGYSTALTPGVEDCDDAAPGLHTAIRGAPDGDGDGYGAGPLAPVCTGGTLPAPYVPRGGDCDDATISLWRRVVIYPDADGDGVGAAPRAIRCLGATPGAGWSEKGWDSNDRDPGVQLAPEDDLELAGTL